MPENRNIVLITLDSLRADHCSFMGYHRKTTPTMDKMAKNGLYFENAIASGVATGPSMMGAFTGEYCPIGSEDFSGEKWRKEFKKRKTLPQVLLEKGYETGAIHPHPYTSAYFGFNKGFKHFENFVQKGQIEDMEGSSKIGSFIVGLRKIINKEGSNLPWESYYNRITEWIKNYKRPYFLWVFLLDTHTPYLPPVKRWSQLNYWKLSYLYWKIQRRNWETGDKKEIERIRDTYDDEIYYSDKFIKRLWEDLKDDDPIFIIHGDHGDGLGEHGFYRHPPMLYEELIHIPLIIYNAGLKGRQDKPISLLGLSPSILELLGEEKEFPSKSFLDGGGGNRVISKVWDGDRRKVAVRMKDWKFITGQKEEDELYLLAEDPYEQKNLVDENSEFSKEMNEMVENHIKHEKEVEKIRNTATKLRI